MKEQKIEKGDVVYWSDLDEIGIVLGISTNPHPKEAIVQLRYTSPCWINIESLTLISKSDFK